VPVRACSHAPALPEEAGRRERCEHQHVAGDARKAGMDLELSDEQAALREVMRDFARRETKPVAREMEQSGRYLLRTVIARQLVRQKKGEQQ
jgi:hypothetical protein